MAKQVGRKMLLKIMVANKLTLVAGTNNATVDDAVEEIDGTTPDPDNPGNPAKYDPFPGTRKVSFSGTFTLTDDAADGALSAVADSATRKVGAEVTIPDFKTYTGDLFLSSMRYEGSLNGMLQYTLTGTLTGNVVIAAIPDGG